MNRIQRIVSIVLITGSITWVSCKKYLDVVPDNIATIDYAFTLRTSAEKFLFNCFSYMPSHGHFNTNPGFFAGDEIWLMDPPKDVNTDFYNIALGLQNASDPYGDYWLGQRSGKNLWIGIRNCNIFLENIHKVPDMQDYEKERWSGEAKFLKAYYHFYLMRMYGPIPVIKENLPISSTPEEVRITRDPLDSCINYVVQLLDEVNANVNIPERIVGSVEAQELGRVTKGMALALKAKVLVTAASPLFNGNSDYVNFKNAKGETLFNPTPDPKKWERAAVACKEAIDFLHTEAHALYTFPAASSFILNDTLKREFDLRGSISDKQSNPEIIWANTASRADINIQRWSMPILNTGATSSNGPKGILAPPIKMAEQFYTKNGVPITEDKTWNFAQRFGIRTAGAGGVTDTFHKFYIKTGETTVNLHFDREPRFYSSLAFDRGHWFGNWVNNSDATKPVLFVKARKGEFAARQGHTNFSATGYWPKKLVSIGTSAAADGTLTYETYPWPEIRLADLYLMYAEALNELNGPGAETYQWINLVRTRAGLKSVQESWTNFSSDPTKFTHKAGLREIIHHERLVELAFEGHRLWDLRRWKKSHIVLNAPVRGWNLTQTDPVAYYKEVLLYSQSFKIRDYFWPIEIGEILKNRNLLQTPGW